MAFRSYPIIFIRYFGHSKKLTNSSKTPITLHERNQGFYWNVECEEQFKAFLTNQREKLEELNEETRRNQDANKLANEIKQNLLAASDKCNLKRRKYKNTDSTKPWFDKECLDLKKCITKIGKKLQANAGDTEIRNELFEKKKKLKKMVRGKQRLYKKNILNEMDQCTNADQKKYWKLVKKLEQKEHNTTHYVTPRSHLEHYKNLLNSKRPLKLPPESSKNGKLDYPITSEELDKAKHILKGGKANGLDVISNEMISTHYPNPF